MKSGRIIMLATLALAAGIGAGWVATRPTLPEPVADALPAYTTRVDDRRNAAFPLAAAAKSMVAPGGGSQVRRQWRDWTAQACLDRGPLTPAARLEVVRNAAAIAQFRQAARRPDFQAVDPLAMVKAALPEAGAWQDVARLAALDARLWAEAGNMPAALERLGDLLTVARLATYADGDPLVTHASGVAMTRTGVGTLITLWPRIAAAPTPLLQAWLARLNVLDHHEITVAAYYRGQRDFMVRRLIHGHVEILSVGGGPGKGSFGKMRPNKRALAQFAAPHFKNEMDHRMAAAEARDFRAAAAMFDEAPVVSPLWSSLVWFFHPKEQFARVVVEVAQSSTLTSTIQLLVREARFDGMRVGLAMVLFRRAHGREAATWADLVPAYLPAAPRDPFWPKAALRFQPGAPAVLWSVGWDGRNDGGATALDVDGPVMSRRIGTTGDVVLWPPGGG